MKTLINNLQNGNKVTQRNLFLVILAITIITVISLNAAGLIHLQALNAK